jgi:hypothetical protein
MKKLAFGVGVIYISISSDEQDETLMATATLRKAPTMAGGNKLP